MAFQKLTPKIHRRRVDDQLVEQVYSVLKDCQVDMIGHVQASLFRGEPLPENLIEQAETENVIMQWYIDIAQTLPLLLFNGLAGFTTKNNPGLGITGNTADTYVPGGNLLYTPPNWSSACKVFDARWDSGGYPAVQVPPWGYLLCSDLTTAESAAETTVPACAISASAKVFDWYAGTIGLRQDTGYTAVIDKRTIKWVYDFTPVSFAGTIRSVHLAKGTAAGAQQFARALLGSPITKTVDDTFRVQWTFTRDLLPGEPA